MGKEERKAEAWRNVTVRVSPGLYRRLEEIARAEEELFGVGEDVTVGDIIVELVQTNRIVWHPTRGQAEIYGEPGDPK